MEYTRFLKIPYFEFGFTINFYPPFTKFPNKIKLSEIPNPPYTLGPDGKFISLYFYSKNIYNMFYSNIFMFYRY